MKKLMSTLAVLALLVGTSIAQDGPKEGHRNGKHGKHHSLLADIPDLTDDQKAQLKEIKQEGKAQIEGQRAELKAVRDKIATLKSSENPDMNAINGLIDKSSKLKAEMEKVKAASEVKARAVLTPQQRKVFDAKQKERKEMRQKHLEERKMKSAE
jgi:protein CpxP